MQDRIGVPGRCRFLFQGSDGTFDAGSEGTAATVDGEGDNEAGEMHLL